MSMAAPIALGNGPPPIEREHLLREKWDRMEVLFQTIRNNARQFEYPAPSVAALESILMRMYFESPLQPPQIPMMASQPPSLVGANQMEMPDDALSGDGTGDEGENS